MKITSILLCIVAGVASVKAQSLQVNLNPAGSSRVYDYFSNAYAQAGLSPQGMYDITTNDPYGPTNPFSPGPWTGFGTLTLSGTPTLVGTENFSITGAAGFDFDSVIAGSFTFFGNYSSSLSGISGNVTLVDGVVTDLSWGGTIAFEFDAVSGSPYVGAIGGTENSFDLIVDDTNVIDFGFGPIPMRYAWDVEGTASIDVVPEPSSIMLLGIAAGALLGARRRRS